MLINMWISNSTFTKNTLQLIDMDCDTEITAFDAYSVLKKSISDTFSDYITLEMFGAVGDGLTEDIVE